MQKPWETMHHRTRQRNKRWIAEFRRDRLSIEDDPRLGSARTATTEENNAIVHEITLQNHCVTTRITSMKVGISKERVEHIIHNELRVRKLSAR